jgi:hypothetical protein
VRYKLIYCTERDDWGRRTAMAADRKKPARARPVPPPGSALVETGGEATLLGEESWRDLSRQQLVWVREDRRHRMQRRTVAGLMFLLGVVLSLGTLALVGVAAGWYAPSFALSVLGLTLTPSFAGWLVVVRSAFRRDSRNDR